MERVEPNTQTYKFYLELVIELKPDLITLRKLIYFSSQNIFRKLKINFFAHTVDIYLWSV